LDKTLSFKAYIENRAVKARSIAGYIRGLNRVYRGAPPVAIRKATYIIVIPKALFGAEI
ncbi:hypothetical protein SODALDRAFT_281668, partial [Sodiomyces alkalinus F11]